MSSTHEMETESSPSGLSRRTFIEMIGFTAVAAVAAGCERAPEGKTIPYLNQPVELTPGKATWYASTCAGCTAACGALVKVRDGRPIKIEGNPDHPLSLGGLCAVGQASVASLYDADRLREPSIDGVAASWAKVDAEVNRRLATAGVVRLLTPTVLSPTGRKVIQRFLERYTNAQHVEVDPVSHAALREAHRRAFGIEMLPAYHFESARLVVGFEADFLGTWLSPVEFARARADRRATDANGGPLRHIQFESALSLTGSNSDRRVQLAPREAAGALRLLARDLLERAGLDLLPPSDGGALRATLNDAVRKTADELWNARGYSLLLVGINDPELQELAVAINHALGNYGTTIDIDAPSLQSLGDERRFDWLIDELKSGAVNCLVVWGSNPVYDSPRGAEFAEAMKMAGATIALAERHDETSSLAQIICPTHHWLESWNDAEPRKGVVSLTQPTIAPLFKTRAAEESLLRWSGDNRSYHDVLRDEWKTSRMPAGARTFDEFWESALRAGVIRQNPSTASAGGGGAIRPWNSATLTSAMTKLEAAPSPNGLDLVLYQKVSMRDGRHANNPLLQELPDPLTRVSWTNYALVSPSTAARLGINDGQVVRVVTGGGSVELPARVMRGTAPDTVAIAVGYGRTGAGRVGNGVGVNAWKMIARGDGGYHRMQAAGATIVPTDRSVVLPITQVHETQEERELVRRAKKTSATTARAGSNPATSQAQEIEGAISMWPEHEYKGHRWGMTIDLDACTGCGACVIGCQVENNVPVVGPDEMTRWREMHWIRIDRYFDGEGDDIEVDFQPLMCVHCENASCESVCPVLATAHSAEGLNMQVYNRCVGTRYCANNCAYKVRRFNWFNYDHSDRIAALALNPDVTVRTRGVMEKCSMCVQRIEAVKITARNERRAIVDGEIEPACAQSCPVQAITFGDMVDAKSRVTARKNDERNYVLLDDLNLRPVVTYLEKRA